MKFPKRFEIEGLNPEKLPVKIVFINKVIIYNNMESARKDLNLDAFAGPMFCKNNNTPCVRFESSTVYSMMNN